MLCYPNLLTITLKKYLFILLIASLTTSANTKGVDAKDAVQTKKKAQFLVAKFKKSNDWKNLAMAYKDLVYFSERKYKLFYADSMLQAAKKTNDNLSIGNAYLTNAIVYYDKKQLQLALDNFIVADEYIVKTKDQYAIHKVKYVIALTKYNLGFYDEAIALFKECLAYFEVENDRAYLNSLHALGLCYNRIGNYKECSKSNKLGIEQGKEFENTDMEPYFILSEGVNNYFEHQYEESIKKLTLSIPIMIARKDFANETVANFYIGKSFWDLKNEKAAIPYFIKVDSSFTIHQYIRTDLIENYELLIDYYKKQKNQKAILYYINQLLKVESFIDHNYKYLSRKIHKEYDTKKLLQEREELQNTYNWRIILAYISLVTMTGVSIVLLFKNAKSKNNFIELMQSNNKITDAKLTNREEEELGINKEVIEQILKNIEIFETEKRFIEKELTLVNLATILNTNAKYASKVIVKYRGKKYIEYIRDLKIDYIIELLKSENKYRNYTNEGLAEEAGFGSTQNFTAAFKAKTGITPTYFIKELKKIS